MIFDGVRQRSGLLVSTLGAALIALPVLWLGDESIPADVAANHRAAVCVAAILSLCGAANEADLARAQAAPACEGLRVELNPTGSARVTASWFDWRRLTWGESTSLVEMRCVLR